MVPVSQLAVVGWPLWTDFYEAC